MTPLMSGRTALTVAMLSLGSGVAAQAQVEVTGSVSIVSDYAFRGISQTLEEAAVQGGIDVAGPVGLYAGVWSSSVNFGEDLGGGARAQMELDVFAGIAPSVAGFDLDLGGLLYAYPGAESDRSYNFFEVYGGVSRAVGPVGLGASAAYSPDYFGGSGPSLWTMAEASMDVPGTPVGLSATIGRQQVDDNDIWGTPDYTAWSAGVSTGILGASVSAGATGTSLEEEECFAGGSELCGTRLILGVSLSM